MTLVKSTNGSSSWALCGLSLLTLISTAVTDLVRADNSYTISRTIDIFGINEALSFPEKFERAAASKFDRLEKVLSRQGRAARMLGAEWTRGHTVAFPRLSWDRWQQEDESFDRVDTWLRAVQQAELNPVMMIGPWPGNRTRDYTQHYLLSADELKQYRRFIRQAVERYDGDGIDDMPGLQNGVHVWEIDNEPDLKNSGSPRANKRTAFCTPKQYADVLIQTARMIRSANPKAFILNGGLYRITNQFGYEYAKDLLSIPGVLSSIDALSVHAYHEGRNVSELELGLKRAKTLASGKPVWLTETSVPSDGGEVFQSEVRQSEILARTVIVVLSNKIERFFWHTLFDPPGGKTSKRREIRSFATNSLFKKASRNSPLVIKPAGETYRRLVEILKNTKWKDINALPVPGGRGVSIGDNRWLVFSDHNTIKLPGSIRKATAIVSGKDIQINPKGRHTIIRADRQVLLLEVVN